MTSHPNVIKKRSHYLMGGCLIDEFYKDGVDGYISFVGHTPTENVIWTDQGLYLDDDLKSIWKNEKENVGSHSVDELIGCLRGQLHINCGCMGRTGTGNGRTSTRH